MTATKTTPSAATLSPTGVVSHMLKVPSPASARKPDTIRSGGVPTGVVIPPGIVPQARGISTCPWISDTIGQLHGEPHQKRHRADIVHDARQGRAQPHQRQHARQSPRIARQGDPGQRIDGTGILQPLAQHRHAGDRDHRRMSEPGERPLGRDQPGDDAGQQRRQRDHVTVQPAGQERRRGQPEDREGQDLIALHLGPVLCLPRSEPSTDPARYQRVGNRKRRAGKKSAIAIVAAARCK